MSAPSRREFILATGGVLAGGAIFGRIFDALAAAPERPIAPCGPASKYVPKIKAAFVRRREEYGMRWPGQIYDGVTAREDYTRQAKAAAEELGLELDLRSEPIYSSEEADKWVAEAAARKPDGLLVLLLDRQEHSWPTAAKAVDSGIPTVIFTPLGSSFTTNTSPLAGNKGCFISASDNFSQAAFGMKMLKAQAKLSRMRFIVLAGRERKDTALDFYGTQLRYLPAQSFLEEYNRLPVTDEMKDIAAWYLEHAIRITGATGQDVLNGVKSFVVARNILEREEGDGITMDCLGALGRTQVSLPCISWSRMNDFGIPAACEADLGACVTHALVQLLFDRPGFQQDPVPDTVEGCLIGSHCCCATRLNGFSAPSEPYFINNHHGKRDATPVTIWKPGQRVTVADVLVEESVPEMLISTGNVVKNMSVPPSGGCVVAVMLKMDGDPDYLAYPGFHQLFFYGDYKRELESYCRLFGIKPTLV